LACQVCRAPGSGAGQGVASQPNDSTQKPKSRRLTPGALRSRGSLGLAQNFDRFFEIIGPEDKRTLFEVRPACQVSVLDIDFLGRELLRDF